MGLYRKGSWSIGILTAGRLLRRKLEEGEGPGGVDSVGCLFVFSSRLGDGRHFIAHNPSGSSVLNILPPFPPTSISFMSSKMIDRRI